jgi:hypothetical protein
MTLTPRNLDKSATPYPLDLCLCKKKALLLSAHHTTEVVAEDKPCQQCTTTFTEALRAITYDLLKRHRKVLANAGRRKESDKIAFLVPSAIFLRQNNLIQ